MRSTSHLTVLPHAWFYETDSPFILHQPASPHHRYGDVVRLCILTTCWGTADFGRQAECILAQYIPDVHTEFGLDLMSIACNISGAAVAGVLVSTEHHVKAAATQRMCSLVRLKFLGVWTSLPFVVVHAAQVAVNHGFVFGVAFLVLSFSTAAAAFSTLQRASSRVLQRQDWQVWVHERVGTRRVRTQLLYAIMARPLMRRLASIV